MPKRSNNFQKLVLYLHKHNHPNVEITESKELTDKVTGNKREVDVYITTTLGNYKLNIAIECVEKSRKADIGWVEMMSKKHEKLETNQLILISKAGFTKQAIKEAEFRNIKTFMFEEIEHSQQSWIFDYKSLFFKVFSQTIERVIFVVRGNGDKLVNVRVVDDTAIFNEKSENVASAAEIVSYILNNKSTIEYFLTHGLEEHKYCTVNWINNASLPIYLQELKGFTLETIEEIRITCKANFKVRNFETNSGQINKMPFVWGNIDLNPKQQLLFVATPNGDQATISIINNEV